MKVIIAGSRTLHPSCLKIWSELSKAGWNITEVVSGAAEGVDQEGELFAINSGLSVKKFPADWGTYGKKAGPIRNKEMADYADALLAFWDGNSPGTKNMISNMKKLGKPVKVVYI